MEGKFTSLKHKFKKAKTKRKKSRNRCSKRVRKQKKPLFADSYKMLRWLFASCTPSKKHLKFVSTPAGDKKVTELPGVAGVLGGRLMAKGYCTAQQVLNQLLHLEKDQEAFRRWLRCECNANCKQAQDCYNALTEYSYKYIM